MLVWKARQIFVLAFTASVFCWHWGGFPDDKCSRFTTNLSWIITFLGHEILELVLDLGFFHLSGIFSKRYALDGFGRLTVNVSISFDYDSEGYEQG